MGDALQKSLSLYEEGAVSEEFGIKEPLARCFKVTWIDSPNGGHQQALKRSFMGPNEVTLKNHLEDDLISMVSFCPLRIGLWDPFQMAESHGI